jgi:hypothetical protein
MPYFPPKFPDCTDCKFFKPETGSVRCLKCDVGEYFEPKIDDRQPDEEELMIIFSKMEGVESDD